MFSRAFVLLCFALVSLTGGASGQAPASSTDVTADAESRIAAALQVARRDLDAGAPEVALELLDLFDEKYPERPDLSFLRGEALSKLARWDDARVAYRRAEDDRRYALDAGLGRARAAAELGEVREAAHALDRAWIAGA